jgi:hypothetical protein
MGAACGVAATRANEIIGEISQIAYNNNFLELTIVAYEL